jgi:hypothetical protein
MEVGRGVGWCGVAERGSVAGSGDALYDRGDGGSAGYKLWLEHSYFWAAIGRDERGGERVCESVFC